MNTPLKSTRGAVDPLTLGALVLVGVLLSARAPSGGLGKDHWWQFWRPNPITAVDKAAAKVAVFDGKIEAANLELLRLAQDSAHATGMAIAAAQAKVGAGLLPERELATAASLNSANTSAMDQAIGAPAPKRLRELEEMVANLNAGVAAGTKALELMQGSLDRLASDKAAVIAERDGARAELAGVTAKLQTFAGERDALARRYERLTFWGRLAGVAALFVAGYVAFLLLRVRGFSNLSKDFVALHEHTKTFVPPEVRGELEKQVAADWLTVSDGTAKTVAKIKAQLRL